MEKQEMFTSHSKQTFMDLQDFIISKEVDKDLIKFYNKGNKSAGVRLRQHMAKLKRMAQDVRNEIQAIKKTLPVKQIKSNKQKLSILKA